MSTSPPASAGILLYRLVAGGGLEVLVAHPGGPLWAHRHEGAWSIPKGLIDPGEDLAAAARREFAEETGHAVEGPALDLGSVRLRSGKVVHGFAIEGDLDPDAFRSNTFPLEWPPRSGRFVDTPEIDEVRWAGPDEAKRLLNPAQGALVDRLVTHLGAAGA